MCGIAAASSPKKNAVPFVLSALQRLEYRGYDSAGVSVSLPHVDTIRVVGRVSELVKQAQDLNGHISIGHTRWATHGEPKLCNVHPLVFGNIILVHNGTVQNLDKLRHAFPPCLPLSSETDSEFIASLIVWHKKKYSINTFDAIRETTKLIQGSFALAVIDITSPQKIFLATRMSPIVISQNNDGIFASSDPIALSQIADNYIRLCDDDIAIIDEKSLQIFDKSNNEVIRKNHTNFTKDDCSLSSPKNYANFMEKEIHEQPKVIHDILTKYISDNNDLTLSTDQKSLEEIFVQIEHIIIIGCGSSYHAGLLAKNWFEKIAGVHTEVYIASEFQGYSSQVINGSLVIFISQSGETADILSAHTRLPADKTYSTLSLCNSYTSTLNQKTDFSWPINAGVEISVAATKTFTAQSLNLLLMSIMIAGQQQRYSEKEMANTIKDLTTLPTLLENIINTKKNIIQEISHHIKDQPNIIFLGKFEDYSLALEASLKIKEIAYLHAEGCASGEFKHGPLAIVDKNLFVICLASQRDLTEKIRIHCEQIKARQGRAIFIHCDDLSQQKEDEISLGKLSTLTAPFCFTVFLQLLALLTAQEKGIEVDKPRNLAKSVTVE